MFNSSYYDLSYLVNNFSPLNRVLYFKSSYGVIMKKRSLILSVLLAGITACSTVTIKPEGQNKFVNTPTYLDSKPFYLWGLSGEHRVDVLKVCNKNEPLQMQSQQTFSDGLLALITLGIYAPHTVKIWCPKEES
jgi:hypothetical protein